MINQEAWDNHSQLTLPTVNILVPLEPPTTVLARRVSGRLLETQTLKNHPSGHPILSNFLKCHFQTN